jgi:hypothetical protein
MENHFVVIYLKTASQEFSSKGTRWGPSSCGAVGNQRSTAFCVFSSFDFRSKMAGSHELIAKFTLNNNILQHHPSGSTTSQRLCSSLVFIISPFNSSNQRKRFMLKVWWLLRNESLYYRSLDLLLELNDILRAEMAYSAVIFILTIDIDSMIACYSFWRDVGGWSDKEFVKTPRVAGC